VVLRINSPGGSGLASDDVARGRADAREAGRRLHGDGPRAADTRGDGRDAIVAQPTTITGSIGVISGSLLRGLYD
jgi:protease-4